jgi:cytochrome c
MKMTLLAAVGSAALMLSMSAHADASFDLAKEKQCMSCHAVDKDTLAPAFKSIAGKYAKRANAEAALVPTVMKGSPDVGGYHWGTMKMPSPGARPAVSEAEAKQLVQWVLSQK